MAADFVGSRPQTQAQVDLRTGASGGRRAPHSREMQIRRRFTFQRLWTKVPQALRRTASEPHSFRPTYSQADSTEHLDMQRGLKGWASIGSIEHPVLCFRPCVRFAKGYCAQGASCDFCHMTHKPARMKEDRKKLRGLSLADLLRVTQKALKQRWGRSPKASPIFALLADEEEFTKRALPHGEGCRLSRALVWQLQQHLLRAKMNFPALLTFVAGRCRPTTANQLMQLMEDLSRD